VTTRKLKIVEVTWHDIAGHGPGWMSATDLEEATHIVCRTVGYLWSKGKDSIKVVSTFTNDGDASDLNVIPVGVVVSIRDLGVVSVATNEE